MMLLKQLLLLLVVMVIAVTLSASKTDKEPHFTHKHGRLMAQKVTCDKYPRVCTVAGSKGPDCCNKQCVNVSVDRLNCGKCGKKCNFSELCCKGKCVNPSGDEYNCGKCSNRCKKGSSCEYGLCSYA